MLNSKIASVFGLTEKTILLLYLFLALYLSVAIIFIHIQPKYATYIVFAISFVPIIVYTIFTQLSVMFLIYIACIPVVQQFSFYFIEIGDFKITPHMIIHVFLFTLLLSYVSSFQMKRKIIFSKVDKAFIIFFIMSLFPLLIGYTFNVNHVKRWLLFYTGVVETILYYFSIRLLLHLRQITEKSTIIALVCTSFASLVVAFIELRTIGFNPIMIYASRMTIGFGYHNTNLFGIHSSLLFPIIVYAFVNKKYSQYRYIAFISLVIILLLSVACFNRGTFLVLFIQVLLLFLLKQNRILIYLILISGLFLALIFNEILTLYILRFFAGSGYETTVTVLDQSANYRFEAWRVGLLILSYYPLGVGAGSFQHMWELYGSIPNIFLGTPHQLLLSIGVDYGIPCLLIFLFIFFSSLKKASLIYKENRNDNALYFYIVTSFVGFIVYGLITDGELSHLTGRTAPNNGYTLILFTIIALIVHKFEYRKLNKVE